MIADPSLSRRKLDQEVWALTTVKASQLPVQGSYLGKRRASPGFVRGGTRVNSALLNPAALPVLVLHTQVLSIVHPTVPR